MLMADNTSILKLFVDSSFAVHLDCRSHMGRLITLGKGAAYSQSTKQKINVHSLTEEELIGIDEVLPQVLWTNYFCMSKE